MKPPHSQSGPCALCMDAALRVVLPLAAGFACYAFWRPASKFYLGVEVPLPPAAGALCASAPDFLWAYAFCQALLLAGTRCCGVVLLAGLTFELLQGVVLPGKPSPADMACYLAACLAAHLTAPQPIPIRYE